VTEGTVRAGFEAVADAFRHNFEANGESGAAFALYVDGVPVVDIWGGWSDLENTRPWSEDTLVLVFSVSKGIVATCVHLLCEEGKLDLDGPVASYWPEFGQAGKQRITLRTVLAHRAGLPVVDANLSRHEVFAGAPVIAAIAAQAPLWEPDTAHGYHARTYGWILSEVVRRVTGMTLGRFFRRRIAAPLGLELFIGLPDELEYRVAPVQVPPAPTDPQEIAIRDRFMGPKTLLGRVLSGPGDLSYGEVWNGRALRAAEIPSSNGIGDARSLARMYAALIGEVDGERLLGEPQLRRATAVASDGPDRVLHLETRFGLGFMLPPTLAPGCGERSFGHPGAGGALAFADPERGLSFGYVTNRMQLGLTGDERTASLVRSVYAAI
jgi:CubicO group peptidase (beta-lactamase class C family)